MARRPKHEPTEAMGTLEEEVRALRREVARFNNHSFVRVQNSVSRLVGLQFLRGLAFGLGTVIGASVLVSFVVYFLSQIDFIPIIGEWASEIARELNIERSGPEANTDGSIDPGAGQNPQ